MLGVRKFSPLAACGLFFAVTLAAFAAETTYRIYQERSVPVRGDFQVGPTRFGLQLAPGEEQTVTLQVLSRQGETAVYKLSTEDFSAGTVPEQPVQLYGKKDGPFSARGWIQPVEENVRLAHGERGAIGVDVKIPADAEPGDHYATLLVERVPDESPEGQGLSVVSRVGSLFLITVTGEIAREASVTGMASRRGVYWTYPVALRLHAENTGTVHAVVQGEVVIRNMFGSVVDAVPLARWVVLRGSTRSMDVAWKPEFAFGRYTATADLSVFGEKAPALQTVFWVIPVLPLLVLVAGMFFVTVLVQYLVMKFEVRRRKR